MKRVLFVSNGHGEEAIAACIAEEVHGFAAVDCDHLALVGDFAHDRSMQEVGPRRRMPSGGLIAMGNLRNILRDAAAGLIGLTLAQRRFLRSARGRYGAAVAVGDTYALLMTLQARAATVYVGTAKSVYVAPYGRGEERVLRRAAAIFVRDAATARRLRERGVAAEAPGNVIVDLYARQTHDERVDAAAGLFAPLLALFPGSRESAYENGAFLCRVLREIARSYPGLGGIMSLAPSIDEARFVPLLVADGWRVAETGDAAVPLSLRDGERELIRAMRAPIGAMIARAVMVLGQAGTANEAAAAGGLPVIAFERTHDRKTSWYRMRQSGLLGEAAIVASGDPVRAAGEVRALLEDPQRRARMGEIGRARMGPTGGARAIAQRIVELCGAAG